MLVVSCLTIGANWFAMQIRALAGLRDRSGTRLTGEFD
jgi:hypothetical protein